MTEATIYKDVGRTKKQSGDEASPGHQQREPLRREWLQKAGEMRFGGYLWERASPRSCGFQQKDATTNLWLLREKNPLTALSSGLLPVFPVGCS